MFTLDVIKSRIILALFPEIMKGYVLCDLLDLIHDQCMPSLQLRRPIYSTRAHGQYPSDGRHHWTSRARAHSPHGKTREGWLRASCKWKA